MIREYYKFDNMAAALAKCPEITLAAKNGICPDGSCSCECDESCDADCGCTCSCDCASLLSSDAIWCTPIQRTTNTDVLICRCKYLDDSTGYDIVSVDSKTEWPT